MAIIWPNTLLRRGRTCPVRVIHTVVAAGALFLVLFAPRSALCASIFDASITPIGDWTETVNISADAIDCPCGSSSGDAHPSPISVTGQFPAPYQLNATASPNSHVSISLSHASSETSPSNDFRFLSDPLKTPALSVDASALAQNTAPSGSGSQSGRIVNALGQFDISFQHTYSFTSPDPGPVDLRLSVPFSVRDLSALSAGVANLPSSGNQLGIDISAGLRGGPSTAVASAPPAFAYGLHPNGTSTSLTTDTMQFTLVNGQVVLANQTGSSSGPTATSSFAQINQADHLLTVDFQAPNGEPFVLGLQISGLLAVGSSSAQPTLLGGQSFDATAKVFFGPGTLSLGGNEAAPPATTPPLSHFPNVGPTFFKEAVDFLKRDLAQFSPPIQKLYTQTWTEGIVSDLAPTAKTVSAALAGALDVYLKIDTLRSLKELRFGDGLTGPQKLGLATSASILYDFASWMNVTPERVSQVVDAKDLVFKSIEFAATKANPKALVLAEVTLFADILKPEFEALAKEPPDQNFRSVTSPVFGLLAATPVDGASQPMNARLSSLGQSADRVVALLNALNTTLNRYQSALAAGDTASASLQLAAAGSFLQAYFLALPQLAHTFGDLRNQLVFEGFLDGDLLGPKDLIAIQDLARANLASGLPADLRDGLLTLGFTDAQITDQLSRFLALDPTTAPTGTDFDAWLGVSQQFEEAVVPEPTTLLLWGTTMAGLGLAAQRRRRKQQLH